jgi:hypothetical protein
MNGRHFIDMLLVSVVNSLTLLFPSYSLLRAACLRCSGPFVGAPSVCFFGQQSAVTVAGNSLEDQHSSFSLIGSPGTHPCEGIHQLQGSFNLCHCESYHTEPLLLHFCLLYGGVWTWSWPRMLQWNFLFFISANRHSIICSIFVVCQYNYQIQSSIQ